MSGTVAIVGAIITALGTVTVGYFTLRATVRSTSAKEKTDENASVLAAWRELNQPLREENARLVELLEREREEHATEMAALVAEHEAHMAALKPLNDEIDKRRRKT